MNLWEKKRKKAGVTRVEIANAMNISEDKVEELEKNMREMPHDKADEYLENLRKLSSKERKLKIAEAKVWYDTVNLNQLIKDFGYKSQAEFAKDFGCERSSVSVWVNKLRPIGTNSLMKLYYFFNNEFNRKVEKKETKKDEVIEWYKDFNFQQEFYKLNLSQQEFSKKYQIAQSIISNLVNQKSRPSQKTIKKLYNIFNGLNQEPSLEKLKVEIPEDTIYPIEESNSEIETTNYYQVLDQEETTPTYEIPTTVDTPVEEDTTREDLCKLKEENERLRKQMARYEFLIDMAIKKEMI